MNDHHHRAQFLHPCGRISTAAALCATLLSAPPANAKFATYQECMNKAADQAEAGLSDCMKVHDRSNSPFRGAVLKACQIAEVGEYGVAVAACKAGMPTNAPTIPKKAVPL